MVTNIVGLIIPSIFVVLLLFIKHPNKRAQQTLILGFLLVIAGYLFEFAKELEFYGIARVLFPIYLPLLFTLYPVLYIYLRLIIWGDQPIPKRTLLKYFSFPLVTLVLLATYFIPLAPDHKQSLIFYTSGDIPPNTIDAAVIITLIVLYYLQAIIFLYALTKLALFINNTSREQIVIKEEYLPLWAWILVYGIYSYEIVGTVILFAFDVSVDNANIWLNNVFNVFIAFMGFFGLKQYDLSVQTKLKKLTLHFENENGAKRISEKLTADQKKNIAETLEKYVSEKKFYLDPNLKIEQLAKKIHVPYKNLSLVINELLGKNFATLLNEYRVLEAKRIIAQNADIVSLEDVYTRVGFNSRSTFNRVFKSITGLTPSEYQESLHSAA